MKKNIFRIVILFSVIGLINFFNLNAVVTVKDNTVLIDEKHINIDKFVLKNEILFVGSSSCSAGVVAFKLNKQDITDINASKVKQVLKDANVVSLKTTDKLLISGLNNGKIQIQDIFTDFEDKNFGNFLKEIPAYNDKNCNVSSLEINENILYSSAYGKNIKLWNINPDSKNFGNLIKETNINSDCFTIKDNYLFYINKENSEKVNLTILDISDVNNIKNIGNNIELKEFIDNNSSIKTLKIEENLLYVIGYSSLIKVFDITNINNISELKTIKINFKNLSSVAIKKNLLSLVTIGDNAEVYDISKVDESRIFELKEEKPKSELSTVATVIVEEVDNGYFAFFGSWEGKIKIYNFSKNIKTNYLENIKNIFGTAASKVSNISNAFINSFFNFTNTENEKIEAKEDLQNLYKELKKEKEIDNKRKRIEENNKEEKNKNKLKKIKKIGSKENPMVINDTKNKIIDLT